MRATATRSSRPARHGLGPQTEKVFGCRADNQRLVPELGLHPLQESGEELTMQCMPFGLVKLLFEHVHAISFLVRLDQRGIESQAVRTAGTELV